MAEGGCLDTSDIDVLLEHLQRMAAGDTGLRIPLRGARSDFDALAYGINALVGELEYARVKLARESAAKSVFLRTMSHECRTPLTAILSIAELLARDAISEGERRDYGERLARNVRGLLAVLDDILDLARLEAGAHVVDKTRVEVCAIVKDVVTSLASVGEGKGVVVRCEEPKERVVVMSDPRRLRQILVNLVGNAIKFTERGEVVVRFSPAIGDTRGTLIDVADTGIGIAPEAQERLFEAFHRGDAEMSSRYGGSGLGLALSRRFAEALGGSLRLVRSEPGRGSVFRLFLPHAAEPVTLPPSADGIDGAALAPSAVSFSVAGLHVLVAEDNEDIRELIRAVLESEGVRVSLVGDGLAATEAALRLEPHVVLMDLAMPRLDGHSAALGLRAAGYRRPILCLTARVAETERIDKGPFDDHLVKPIEIADLLRKLSEHGRIG